MQAVETKTLLRSMEMTKATRATAEILRKANKKQDMSIEEAVDDMANKKVETTLPTRAKTGSKKLYGGRKKSILQRQATWHQWRKRTKKKKRNRKLLLHCQANKQTKTDPEKTWPEENQETNQPQSKSHGKIKQGRRKQQWQPSQRNWKAQTKKEEANQLQPSKSESSKNLRKSRRAQQR